MNPAHPNWHYVYVLRSKEKNLSYIGCTGNLEQRLEEHSSGKVFTTKKMLPVELMYYEAFLSKDLAYDRERKLKSYGNSLAKLKARIGWAG